MTTKPLEGVVGEPGDEHEEAAGKALALAATDLDDSLAVSLTRAEIDVQIETARKYTRSLAKAQTKIVQYAAVDEETAVACCYALIRKKKGARADDEDNKAIEGPSIRLAEIAVAAWGNCRVDARVIAVNREEKYVEAQGIFHDLETNAATRKVVRRRISTKGGYLFSDDMITVTGNAACSIALRNAILAGIPRGAYWPGYLAARNVIAGTVETLGENRARAYRAFASYGVTPQQIHEHLGVAGEADIGLEHIAQLRAAHSAIKNGEATVSEMFGKPTVETKDGVKDPLNDDIGETGKAAQAAQTVGQGEVKTPKGRAAPKTESAGTAAAHDVMMKAGVETREEVRALDPAEAGARATVDDTAAKAATADATASVVANASEKPKDTPPPSEAPTAPPADEAKPAPISASAVAPAAQFLDEPSYTAHVAELLAAAQSATAAREAMNAKAERAYRRQPWVTVEASDKWRAMLAARIAELTPKED